VGGPTPVLPGLDRISEWAGDSPCGISKVARGVPATAVGWGTAKSTPRRVRPRGLLQVPLQRSRNGFRDRREQPYRGRTSGEGSAQRPALGWLHGPYG
jgi:hypothetical protein